MEEYENISKSENFGNLFFRVKKKTDQGIDDEYR